ncbi:MAG: SPOR domain-containing protein [Alphaproteobacteria bacterium]
MRADFDEFDDFTEEDKAPSRALSWAVLGMAVTGFIALAWYVYHSGSSDGSGEPLLVVKADTAPVKVAPVEPGGEIFPHQDKTIYDTIASPDHARENPKSEKLLAAPEEPVFAAKKNTKTWVNEKLKSSDEAEAVVNAQLHKDNVVAKEMAAEQQQTIPSAAAPPMSEVQAKPEPIPVPQSIVGKFKPAAAEAPAPVSAPTAPVDSGFKVQLGAFKSQDEAERYWLMASEKHAGVLGGHTPMIVRADLPNGTFYRLRAAGFASAAAAKSACAALSAKGQACFYAGK